MPRCVRFVPSGCVRGPWGSGAGAAAQTSPPADLDAYVTRAMKTFDVPGIAVAIVKDGRWSSLKATASANSATPRRLTRHALRHRLQHESVHRRRARHAGRSRQAFLDDPVYQRLRIPDV